MKNSVKHEKISCILYCALENEYSLDSRYRSLNSIPIDNQSLPNYKVMKQIAIRGRIGNAYPVFLAMAPWILAFLTPVLWILALSGSVLRKTSIPKAIIYRFVPTTEQAHNLIKSALVDDSVSDVYIKPMPSSSFKLGQLLGTKRVLESVFVHILLWIKLLKLNADIRRDMILHGRDAFSLALMSIYASSNGETFITDDHYQRWAHVLSHTAKDFRIVQHGFLDEELVLPNSGGVVTCLYLRDGLFRASFERYYAIADQRLFSPLSSFVQTPLSGDALLLASSFPSIDEEIRLLHAIRASRRDLPIIVKFHPVHRYDSRREKLAECASLVYEGLGNPGCRIFVSYGSFMEFDYRRQGIATVSIARSGSVEAAADEIRSLLAPVYKEQNIG
jgi:hypothetical protein